VLYFGNVEGKVDKNRTINVYESDFGNHVLKNVKPINKKYECFTTEWVDFFPLRWVKKKYKKQMIEYILNKKLCELFEQGTDIDIIYDKIGIFKC
jgi:hypothetical protein